MDQNSLPTVPDLDAFPRLLQLLILGGITLAAGFLLLAVVVGVLAA